MVQFSNCWEKMHWKLYCQKNKAKIRVWEFCYDIFHGIQQNGKIHNQEEQLEPETQLFGLSLPVSYALFLSLSVCFYFSESPWCLFPWFTQKEGAEIQGRGLSPFFLLFLCEGTAWSNTPCLCLQPFSPISPHARRDFFLICEFAEKGLKYMWLSCILPSFFLGSSAWKEHPFSAPPSSKF